MPKSVIKQLEERQAQEKRKPGRPKGSKDSQPRKKRNEDELYLIDPQTGVRVRNEGQNAIIVGRMGDERVTQFVLYHMEMMKMREGCDSSNVPDLYNRFYNYLKYCAEHGIIPNNMNAYYAIGISRDQVWQWKTGKCGSPAHMKFAQDLTGFFASVHEQGAIDGMFNPISAMFWQKAHDGMIEASKLEVTNTDPLGEKKSAEDIAKAYSEVELPD